MNINGQLPIPGLKTLIAQCTYVQILGWYYVLTKMMGLSVECLYELAGTEILCEGWS